MHPGLFAIAIDLVGLLQVFSPHSMGQACPVGPNLAFTARHVAVKERADGPPARMSLVWSDGTGESGSAWTVDYDLRRDVALIQSETPFGRPYPVAQEAPGLGDEVWIAGYNFTSRMERKTHKTRIRNLVAAHLILDEPAESGFSGSCVLNANNEVVGIFHWSTGRLGIASAVWGQWSQIGWLPPDERQP